MKVEIYFDNGYGIYFEDYNIKRIEDELINKFSNYKITEVKIGGYRAYDYQNGFTLNESFLENLKLTSRIVHELRNEIIDLENRIRNYQEMCEESSYDEDYY